MSVSRSRDPEASRLIAVSSDESNTSGSPHLYVTGVVFAEIVQKLRMIAEQVQRTGPAASPKRHKRSAVLASDWPAAYDFDSSEAFSLGSRNPSPETIG